jgi:hypothetical protein
MLAMPIFPLPQSGPRSLNFTIREITGRWDRRNFVRFAAHVYRGDRYWAPGVISERRRALDPGKNPALAHIRLGLFMAESRTLDEIVGAIAVWFDSRGDAVRSTPGAGCFGLFESVNEGEVISGLLEAADTWLREHLPGAGSLRGPMDPDPCRSPGLLVEGYNHKPAVLMPYNPPYYAELIEDAGYEPNTELLAYRLDLAALRDASGVVVTRPQAERDLVLREIGGAPGGRTCLPQAEQGMAGTTWRLGPGSPAVTFPEMLFYLKRIAGGRPSAIILAACAGEDGDPVAFGLAAPNTRPSTLTMLGMHLMHGRLSGKRSAVSPEMASRRARQAGIRLPPIVRADCRISGLERLLLSGLLTRAAQRGYTAAEISPVTASDVATTRTLAEYGANPYKTYHIYEKRF